MIAPVAAKLRVMHVLHSLGAGGAERIVFDLAQARRDELDTVAVCLDELGSLAEPARAAGIAIECTGRVPGLDTAQVRRLAGLIRHYRPDVIHAHQSRPTFTPPWPPA